MRDHIGSVSHQPKPLAKVKKLGWPLERMLIADDTPAKCVRNYGNAIYTQPWEGDEVDGELALLSLYLATSKDVSNVRTIEKRRWREKVAAGHCTD